MLDVEMSFLLRTYCSNIEYVGEEQRRVHTKIIDYDPV
jgi:hypothetical protein